jgi:adenine deaminase
MLHPGKTSRCCRLWRALAVSVTLATAVLSCAAYGQAPAGRILIDRVHVLDGHGGRPVPGRVLIEGERIVQILPAPSGTTVVDGEGGYLLPGFVDMPVTVRGIENDR